MSLFNYFRTPRKSSAEVARDRLQVIVAHQRREAGMPDYLPRMQRDLLEVIRRYVQVKDDAVDIQIDRDDGCEVLELNITLSEEQAPS